jgi:hypothetical protein
VRHQQWPLPEDTPPPQSCALTVTGRASPINSTIAEAMHSITPQRTRAPCARGVVAVVSLAVRERFQCEEVIGSGITGDPCKLRPC